MVDRHAVQQMLMGGLTYREVAQHFGISKRTGRRTRREPEVEEANDGVARRQKESGEMGLRLKTLDRCLYWVDRFLNMLSIWDRDRFHFLEA